MSRCAGCSRVGIGAAAPVAILCLFFWGVLHALYRWRRLRAVARVSRATLMPKFLRGLVSHGVSGLLQALDIPVADHSATLVSAIAVMVT